MIMTQFDTATGLDHSPADHIVTYARRHDDPLNMRNKNPYLIPFILISVFAVLELYVGIWSKSLALLSDAWHMFSDVFALGLAATAAHSAQKSLSKNVESKFEIIASIINAAIMIVVVVWIVVEAISRFKNPQPIAGFSVMVVAFIGLIVNIVVVEWLHNSGRNHGHGKSLNHQAAFLHVIGDILGSIAALVAGAVIYFTGWLLIDPILSVAISILLFIGTANLITNIWQTLQGKANAHDHHDHHGHHH
jgi:cobalt-zinc-cadmium efflux system protein